MEQLAIFTGSSGLTSEVGSSTLISEETRGSDICRRWPRPLRSRDAVADVDDPSAAALPGLRCGSYRLQR